MRHPRHLDLKIDTIEQGAGESGPVTFDHCWSAGVAMLGFALLATGPGFIVATSINKAG